MQYLRAVGLHRVAAVVEWARGLVGGGDMAGALTRFELPEAKRVREALKKARDEAEEVKETFDRLKKESEEDFGARDQWWPLRDQCFRATEGEHSYSVCPYKKAEQGSTGLGSWAGWGAGSRGPRSRMLFTGGQKCWQGPQRSLTVAVTCGSKPLLRDIVEPNMCEYTAVLESPAACMDDVAWEASKDSPEEEQECEHCQWAR